MCGNMKLFLVLNRISHLFALLTREISWSTLEIDFIFPHIHVLFSTSSLSHKTMEEVLDDALLKRGLRDFTLKKEQYECIKSTINGNVVLSVNFQLLSDMFNWYYGVIIIIVLFAINLQQQHEEHIDLQRVYFPGP